MPAKKSHLQLAPVIHAKFVSPTRIPVSSCNWVFWDGNKASHSLSQNENINVRSRWSQCVDLQVIVTSRFPDHSLLPAICETALSCLDHVLICFPSDVERFHESAGVALPIHQEFQDLCSTHQTQSWYSSLVSSTLVGSDLLHRANSLQIELSNSCFQRNSHCNSPVVVASNVQSQNGARK